MAGEASSDGALEPGGAACASGLRLAPDTQDPVAVVRPAIRQPARLVALWDVVDCG